MISCDLGPCLQGRRGLVPVRLCAVEHLERAAESGVPRLRRDAARLERVAAAHEQPQLEQPRLRVPLLVAHLTQLRQGPPPPGVLLLLRADRAVPTPPHGGVATFFVAQVPAPGPAVRTEEATWASGAHRFPTDVA